MNKWIMNTDGDLVPQMSVQQLIDQIKGLSSEERAELLNQLGPAITIIFCGSSVVNGVSVQINDTDNWEKVIEKIPPEALGEFLKSLGDFAKNRL
ncbi:hypothetical protein VB715_18710 [Crocosphaera sp. UHCC 0190]|uniref:hypothetical protein n=1 Tax=Crocosphaera sp. UHCC 0190 TaxID=3110246 RepID=UPI002B202718|nr:hypothetical protein [Crocosphaera sp. UHCC 0190]MEA5511807.1 hypothetical protein [Crocosphaera sp. UHCC 0190]